MKGLIEGKEAVLNAIAIGPVKVDNPLVEGVLATAAVVSVLYTLFKVLNDKQAAENIATACGKHPDNG